jgi:hypothetical protein
MRIWILPENENIGVVDNDWIPWIKEGYWWKPSTSVPQERWPKKNLAAVAVDLYVDGTVGKFRNEVFEEDEVEIIE